MRSLTLVAILFVAALLTGGCDTQININKDNTVTQIIKVEETVGGFHYIASSRAMSNGDGDMRFEFDSKVRYGVGDTVELVIVRKGTKVREPLITNQEPEKEIERED